MPIDSYDSAYGGKKGSAREAYAAMRKEYGDKKGKSVFYALANKKKVKRKKRRKVRHAR